MLPASIYVTEDFGASYFPDANGNFGRMSTAAPETHIQVEGDFKENLEVSSTSSNWQPQTHTFGAFRRNEFLSSSTNDTRRRSAGKAVYSFKIVQAKMAKEEKGKVRFMQNISKVASVSYNWFRKTSVSLCLMCFNRIVNSCLIV